MLYIFITIYNRVKFKKMVLIKSSSKLKVLMCSNPDDMNYIQNSNNSQLVNIDLFSCNSACNFFFNRLCLSNCNVL